MNVYFIRMLAAAAVGGAFFWLASAFGESQDEPAWRDMNAEVSAWLDGESEAEPPVEAESVVDSENAPLPPAPEPAGSEPAPAVEALPDVMAPAEALAASDGRVDINRATAEELDALPGIGPAKAKAIVDYREANGPFATVDALMNVKGIGPAVFGKIEASITVGRASSAPANADGGK